MTNTREEAAVDEAIKLALDNFMLSSLNNAEVRHKATQAAIAASNSKYIAGLVEALKHYATQGDFMRNGIVCNDEGVAKHALNNLPLEVRQ